MCESRLYADLKQSRLLLKHIITSPMLRALRKAIVSFLITLLAATNASSLVARQSSALTPGTYVMGAISVPGFNIGAISGALVGVANTSSLEPVSHRFPMRTIIT